MERFLNAIQENVHEFMVSMEGFKQDAVQTDLDVREVFFHQSMEIVQFRAIGCAVNREGQVDRRGDCTEYIPKGRLVDVGGVSPWSVNSVAIVVKTGILFTCIGRCSNPR